MKLYLLRHGEAGTAARDDIRALTTRGHRDAMAIGAWLAARQALPGVVWVSPLVRARQTLECVFAANQCTRPVHEETLLTPDTDPQDLLTVLQSLDADTLLVAHNPILSRLLAWLVKGREHAATPVLGTAHLAILEGERVAPGSMRLLSEQVPGA